LFLKDKKKVNDKNDKIDNNSTKITAFFSLFAP